MKRADIIADMRTTFKGGFISRKQFAEYLNYKDPHCVDRYLFGLEQAGNTKKYFIPDVVDSLLGR